MTNDASDGGDDGSSSPDFTPLDGDSHATDTLFKAMGDRRARHVLSYLDAASSEVLTLEDIADAVAEWEAEAGAATDAEDHRRRVAIDLHHNHLPKLDEAAIVDYDPRSKMVRNWGDDRVETCLELYEAAKGSD